MRKEYWKSSHSEVFNSELETACTNNGRGGCLESYSYALKSRRIVESTVIYILIYIWYISYTLKCNRASTFQTSVYLKWFCISCFSRKLRLSVTSGWSYMLIVWQHVTEVFYMNQAYWPISGKFQVKNWITFHNQFTVSFCLVLTLRKVRSRLRSMLVISRLPITTSQFS